MKVIGQPTVVSYLTRGLTENRLSPSLLFCGGDGTGKRLAAVELAKALVCETKTPARLDDPLQRCDRCDACRKVGEENHPDVLTVGYSFQAALLKEKEAQQKTIKIDSIRALSRFLSFRPSESARRIAIVENAQTMTNDAANNVLKILEEPPSYGQIILLATDEKNLPNTIRSRCAVLRFRPLPVPDIARWLTQNKSVEWDRAETIAQNAGGSLSAAIRLIDEEPFSIDIDAYSADEFFELLSDPRFRDDSRGKAEKIIAWLVEEAQRRLGEGDLSQRRRLEALLAARRQINRYVSPRLVLENLYLNLQSHRSSLK